MSKSEKIPSWGHVQKEFHAEELETAEDLGWIFKEKIVKGKGLFSEIIPIDKEGKLTPEDKKINRHFLPISHKKVPKLFINLLKTCRINFPNLYFILKTIKKADGSNIRCVKKDSLNYERI